MPLPDNTLTAIRTKVRRLTRSPSTAQLSDTDLDSYINTFILYDFPEHLRTFNLRQSFTFYANAFQDEYPTDEVSFAGVTTNLLYNFQNLYLTVHPPFYAAGYQTWFSQSRTEFFQVYPKTNSIASLGTAGDGVTTLFTGVIPSAQAGVVVPGVVQNYCLLKNQVLFDSVDTNQNGLSLVDVPIISTTTGNQTSIGNLYDPNGPEYQAALATPPTVPFNPAALAPGTGIINYVTGQYTINFTAAPGVGVTINSQTVPQVASLPQAVLYFDNKFILRPVPDQPYRINFEVFARPTALLESNAVPQLEEWWQYIAYGAAKKVFEDRMDVDSVALILPEYRKQENLCLRRTIVQITNERTATIYTQQTGSGAGGNGWGFSGTGPY